MRKFGLIVLSLILVLFTPLIILFNILKWIVMCDDMYVTAIIGDYIDLWADIVYEWNDDPESGRRKSNY